MWSDPFKTEKQTEVTVQQFTSKQLFWFDSRKEYVEVICNSISMEIVFILN